MEVSASPTPVTLGSGDMSSVSLRPGGGRGFHRFSAPSNGSDGAQQGFLGPGGRILSGFGSVRPVSAFKETRNKTDWERIRYGKEDLLQYQQTCTDVSAEVADTITEINSILAEDGDWSRHDGSGQSSARPTEDMRDWRTRTPVLEDKDSKGVRRDDRPYRDSESPSSRHSSMADNRQAPPAIVKSASPWMPRRGVETDKERVFRTVKGILNKLTPEKYDVLLEQLLQSGIDSAEILQGVISLIFDKAVAEPTFCQMYSQLCVNLNTHLPEFPSPEPNEKPITFRRILLNTCQEEFEGADALRAEIREMTSPEQEADRIEKERKVKYRTLGNIKFIGELFKQKMIQEKIVHACIQELLGDPKTPPAEENVEALCQLFSTVGIQVEENPKSIHLLDSYFIRLKELTTNKQLPSRIRFMVRDILDLRSNKWIPRREEVKAKTLHEIHVEAEQKLGLRPGSVARNGRTASGAGLNMGLGKDMGFGGRAMPGMPMMMPGAPGGPGVPGVRTPSYAAGLDDGGWETAPSRKNKREIAQGAAAAAAANAAVHGNIPASRYPPTMSTGSRILQKTLPQGTQGSVIKSALIGGGAPAPSPAPAPIPAPAPAPAPSPALASARTVSEPAKKAGVVKAGPGVTPAVFSKKCEALLEEYFQIADMKEAALCLQELKAGEYHDVFVQKALMMAFEKKEKEVEMVMKLLVELSKKMVLLSEEELKGGLLLVGEQLEEFSIDAPKSPTQLGGVMGGMVSGGVLEWRFVGKVMEKIESDEHVRWMVLSGMLNKWRSCDSSLVTCEFMKSVVMEFMELLKGASFQQSDVIHFLHKEGISV